MCDLNIVKMTVFLNVSAKIQKVPLRMTAQKNLKLLGHCLNITVSPCNIYMSNSYNADFLFVSFCKLKHISDL
jgi:hypothetical protein